MDVAHSIALAGTWHGAPCDRLVLDYEARHRRRVVLVCESGREVLLELAEAARLRDGDALLTDAGPIEVAAAPEPLLELEAGSPAECVRLAWHLGNRHVPAQLGERTIRIRADHVLAQLARQLGARVRSLHAPFEPEAGAYAAHAHDVRLAPARR